jgi:hypothetical protein
MYESLRSRDRRAISVRSQRADLPRLVLLRRLSSLIELPRSELRKLRRQAVRIERRPIHHSGRVAPAPARGGFASDLPAVDSIPIARPTIALIYRIPKEEPIQ